MRWLAALLIPAALGAQSIQYSQAKKIWLLTTRHSSYAMGVGADGALRNLYWGAPLWRIDDLNAPAPRRDVSSFDPRQMLENEEYPGWGGPRYYEPALKISRPDGDRDLVLRYASHLIEKDNLDIILKDIHDPIEVTLHYRVYPEEGIIRRSATIRNGTPQPLTLDSAQSAAWYLPPGEGYQLTYLSGRWAAETQINHEPIHEGQKVLESRKGHTSHNFNPWFAIDAGDAAEDHGRVWFGALDKLASENNIRYFKWDMNRAVSEPGWPDAGPVEERRLWVDYVRNLYDIIDRLRAKHPTLEIESCSGGGGRIDLGILQRVDEVWTSDNTEALDRLRIQEGFSMAYAPKIMSAWVTDVPNMNGRSVPLPFRFLVAMQGALGVGANLNKFSEQDTATATRMIALYKRIRPTVQTGDLYRLASPRTHDVTVNQYVSGDGKQSVVFAFRHSQEYNVPAPEILLRGLDEKATYRVEAPLGKLQERQAQFSGAYLMRVGLNVNLRGDYDATTIVLERQ